jgi:hypothetical protein
VTDDAEKPPVPAAVPPRIARHHRGPLRSHGVRASVALLDDFSAWCRARGWTLNGVLVHWMRAAVAPAAKGAKTIAQINMIDRMTDAPIVRTDMQTTSETLVDDPTELLTNREALARTPGTAHTAEVSPKRKRKR